MGNCLHYFMSSSSSHNHSPPAAHPHRSSRSLPPERPYSTRRATTSLNPPIHRLDRSYNMSHPEQLHHIANTLSIYDSSAPLGRPVRYADSSCQRYDTRASRSCSKASTAYPFSLGPNKPISLSFVREDLAHTYTRGPRQETNTRSATEALPYLHGRAPLSFATSHSDSQSESQGSRKFLSGLIKPKSWDTSKLYAKFVRKSRAKCREKGERFVLPHALRGVILPDQFYRHKDVLHAIIKIQSLFRAHSARRRVHLLRRLKLKEETLCVKGLSSLIAETRDQHSTAPSMCNSIFNSATASKVNTPYALFKSETSAYASEPRSFKKLNFDSVSGPSHPTNDAISGSSIVRNRLALLAKEQLKHLPESGCNSRQTTQINGSRKASVVAIPSEESENPQDL